MKKIISMLTLIASLTVMCATSAFAAGDLTLTSSTDAAAQNDEVIVSASLGTSNGLKSLGLKITFDVNDFELGVSAESKVAEAEYRDYIGTPDFPTLDDVTKTLLGRASYVDDTYYNTYTGYASTKKLGDPTIDYQVKDGKCYVTFGYAVSTAKNALNKIDGMAVGGVVLKVKTDAKKEAKITIEEATYSGADGVDTPCVSNEVAIALNGYGTEEDKPVVMEEAVAGNEMQGSDGEMWKTALTKISFKGVENPVVKLAKDDVDSGKTYELPADVKGGTTDIIGIIRYAAGEKGTFVLSVFDGETSETSIASTTYVAK